MGGEVIRIVQFGGGREKGGSVEVEGALHGLEGAMTTICMVTIRMKGMENRDGGQ
jgi:hypothetical protein